MISIAVSCRGMTRGESGVGTGEEGRRKGVENVAEGKKGLRAVADWVDDNDGDVALNGMGRVGGREEGGGLMMK